MSEHCLGSGKIGICHIFWLLPASKQGGRSGEESPAPVVERGDCIHRVIDVRDPDTTIVDVGSL